MNTESKYNIFIVDTYNLFYKSSFIEAETIISYDKDTFHIEGIVGFIKAIESYVKRFGNEDNTIIYWLFDNAKSSIKKYRKALSEDYKKTRIEQPSWFYSALDMLELILKNYRNNSYLYRIKFIEADDYMPAIIKNYVKKEDNVLLISEDEDWFRGLSDNVHQYAKGRIYNKEIFLEEYNFEPSYSNICFYKSFYGDKSDNILPILKEFPKMFFLEIIKNCSTMYDFINMIKNKMFSFLDLGWQTRIIRDEEKLLLNWNLVTAIEFSETELETYKVTCKFNAIKLRIIYDSLQLIGKIDKDRFKIENKKNMEFDEMLQGIPVKRK